MRTPQTSQPEPASTSLLGGRVASTPLFLVAVAISVAGCVSAADDPQGFTIEIIGFIAVCFAVAIVASRLLTRKLWSAFGGLVPTPIENGMPGEAIIQTIADTGVTMSSPDVGANAPRYLFGLKVMPDGGGDSYEAEVNAFVPRLYVPMVLPGKRVGVTIDPANPTHLSIDFSRMDGPS